MSFTIITKYSKPIFFLSLILNIIFTTFFLHLVHSKGGMEYIANKFLYTDYSKTPFLPNYYERKSLFDILPNSKSEIVFLGSSKTERCEWAELFQDDRVINRGIGGDTTLGILHRLDEVVASSPLKIFIMIGSNDLKNGEDIPSIISNYQKIIETILEKSPRTQIYIQNVIPVNNNIVFQKLSLSFKDLNQKIVTLNDHLKNLSVDYNIPYIDMWTSFSDNKRELRSMYTEDGLHFNGKAYLVWMSLIRSYVEDH